MLARSLAAMNNEDFRKLLDKPRVVQEPPRVSQPEQDQRREAKATEDNDGKPRATNRLGEIHAKYVDRAELRRKGVEDLGEDPLEMKGLDFGLLAKARAEKGQARGRGAGKGQGADSDADADTDADADSGGEMGEEDAANHARYALGKTATTATTASGAGKQGRRLARAIEAALLEVTKDGKVSSRKASVASTSYVYRQADAYEIPVIRKRGGLGRDGEDEGDVESGAERAERKPLPNAVVNEICTIMRYCGGGGIGGRKKKPVDEEVAAQDTVDEDMNTGMGPNVSDARQQQQEQEDSDDIFGDAGTDYVATATKEEGTGGTAGASMPNGKPATYFSGTATDARATDGDQREEAALPPVSASGPGDVVVPTEVQRRMMQSSNDYYDDYYGGVDGASDVEEEPEEDKAPAALSKKARKLASKKEQRRLDREMDGIQKIFDDKGLKHFDEAPQEKKQIAGPKKKRRI